MGKAPGLSVERGGSGGGASVAPGLGAKEALKV